MEKKRYILSKTKSSLVLELLRGSDIEVLSRRETITVSDLSSWRNEFIKNGEQGFKRNPEESKLLEAHRLIGQLQMELELRKKKSQLLTYAHSSSKCNFLIKNGIRRFEVKSFSRSVIQFIFHPLNIVIS